MEFSEVDFYLPFLSFPLEYKNTENKARELTDAL